jgi:hypothetical protein
MNSLPHSHSCFCVGKICVGKSNFRHHSPMSSAVPFFFMRKAASTVTLYHRSMLKSKERRPCTEVSEKTIICTEYVWHGSDANKIQSTARMNEKS